MRNRGDAMSLFVLLEDSESMMEIKLRFPGIFRRGIPFPHGQVQSSARGTLVGDNVIDFVLFFGINQVRRRL